MKNVGRVLILIAALAFMAMKPIGLGAAEFISCKEDSEAADCILLECCLNEGSNTCACDTTGSPWSCSNWAGTNCTEIGGGQDLPQDPPQS